LRPIITTALAKHHGPGRSGRAGTGRVSWHYRATEGTRRRADLAGACAPQGTPRTVQSGPGSKQAGGFHSPRLAIIAPGRRSRGYLQTASAFGGDRRSGRNPGAVVPRPHGVPNQVGSERRFRVLQPVGGVVPSRDVHNHAVEAFLLRSMLILEWQQRPQVLDLFFRSPPNAGKGDPANLLVWLAIAIRERVRHVSGPPLFSTTLAQ